MTTRIPVKKFAGFTAFISLLLILNSCEVADNLLNGTVGELEGDWSCNETSEIFKSTSSVYTVTISADPDNLNGVIIDNFYDVNISVKATVSGRSFVISNQNAQDGYTVYGSGTINANNDEITLNYVVNDGSTQDDHVSAVYTKL
jgi:hypothetical protein